MKRLDFILQLLLIIDKLPQVHYSFILHQHTGFNNSHRLWVAAVAAADDDDDNDDDDDVNTLILRAIFIMAFLSIRLTVLYVSNQRWYCVESRNSCTYRQITFSFLTGPSF